MKLSFLLFSTLAAFGVASAQSPAVSIKVPAGFAVVVRKLESTAFEIMKSVHPHPTISEAFKGATEAAYGEAVDL